jgi:hypothetical protein
MLAIAEPTTNDQLTSIRAVVRKTLIRLSSNRFSNWRARLPVTLVNCYVGQQNWQLTNSIDLSVDRAGGGIERLSHAN